MRNHFSTINSHTLRDDSDSDEDSDLSEPEGSRSAEADVECEVVELEPIAIPTSAPTSMPTPYRTVDEHRIATHNEWIKPRSPTNSNDDADSDSEDDETDTFVKDVLSEFARLDIGSYDTEHEQKDAEEEESEEWDKEDWNEFECCSSDEGHDHDHDATHSYHFSNKDFVPIEDVLKQHPTLSDAASATFNEYHSELQTSVGCIKVREADRKCIVIKDWDRSGLSKHRFVHCQAIMDGTVVCSCTKSKNEHHCDHQIIFELIAKHGNPTALSVEVKSHGDVRRSISISRLRLRFEISFSRFMFQILCTLTLHFARSAI